MAVCPVCGCKTEELDFVERKIIDTQCKVCSFCNRQLNVFDTATEPTEAQLRWLDAVIGKEVSERAEEIISSLKAIRSRYPEKEVNQPAAPAQPQINVVQQGVVKKLSEDGVINELQQRITALENELRIMKRKQMIKTIIELGAPVALLILLIIILLSSDIIDNFKTLFDMAGIAL